MLPLADTRTSERFPFWVFLFIAVNIWVFYLEITAFNPDLFIAQYALIPSLVDFNRLETLKPFFTSQFLHGGLFHILSNMWFLHIFGDNVEGRVGFFIFPLLYLFSGAAGGLLQYVFVPDSNIPMLGASGAIAGVLGAYFAFFPDNRIRTLVPIFGFPTIMNIPASLMLVYWFFTQIFSGSAAIVTATTALGGVAWFAHIGGFAFGFVAGRLSR